MNALLAFRAPTEMTDSTVKEVLRKLTVKEELTETELDVVFRAIMTGGATAAQSAAFLTLLKMKGETAGELAVLSRAANSHAKPCFVCEDSVDIVGTGGDGLGTFNISTAAALIVAGLGVKVIKVYR
jgi:anthranilate phosphoribosyltransferase